MPSLLTRRLLLSAAPQALPLLLASLSQNAEAAEPVAKRQAASRATLGINLSGPADWNTELPFVDVFRLSRPWISQRNGASWGTGPALALDPNGYVTRLEPECFAESPLCTIDGGHYPSGEYTVLYDGIGKFTFGGPVQVSYEGGQHLVGAQGAENNDTITHLFEDANRSARMGQLYTAFLDAWKAAGGDLFCAFTSVAAWSKWGSWGALQFYDDRPEQYPKFMALMRWAKQIGQDTSV